MNAIQSIPSRPHLQPTREIPLQNLAAPKTGISDGDDRSNALNEAPILAACRSNNLPWLLKLLAKDPGLAQLTALSGETNLPVSPLHVTAQGGHVEATEHLLNTVLQGVPMAEKANVAITLMTIRHKKGGETPFYLAAQNAHDLVVTTFLNSLLTVPESERSNVARQVMNATDADGATPLYVAARHVFVRIVRYILEVISKVPESERAELGNALVNTANKDGATPLYAAASGIYKPIVAMLLEYGADPEQAKVRCVPGTCRRSNTPLQVASQRRAKGIVALINKAIQSRSVVKEPDTAV